MNSSIRPEDFSIAQNIAENLESCIMGKSSQIRLLLTALFADGHVLLEDVPGTGKTVLVKALAKSIQGSFQRIQCNPDLLPTDITGVSIYHPKQERFIFRPGPVMTNILLIDEINRASTKTQSALLEAMEEKSVTVDGEARDLPTPFLLLATQNPIDFEGTYMLPEAQLDRFMMKFSLGYPDKQTEKQMVESFRTVHPLESISAVTDIAQFAAVQNKIRFIHMDDAVTDYAIEIVRCTREHRSLRLGASPRGTLSLIQAAKAYAFLNQRDYVTPDDIKFLTPFVLNHRLILHANAVVNGDTKEQIVNAILEKVKVPIRMEN